LLMIGATAAPIWIVLSSWNPANVFQLAVIMIFSMGSPLGGFWMIYRAIRDEKRPIPYVLLAFVPLAFLWYYVERVRPVRDGK
jgi:hypothetical protein